jgi:hypothetical protein
VVQLEASESVNWKMPGGRFERMIQLGRLVEASILKELDAAPVK